MKVQYMTFSVMSTACLLELYLELFYNILLNIININYFISKEWTIYQIRLNSFKNLISKSKKKKILTTLEAFYYESARITWLYTRTNTGK